MELSDWFKGFEKGIARLPEGERAIFFAECGKNCVDGGVLQVYKRIYDEACGDIDTFFVKANELSGVKGEIVQSGSVYRLIFTECTCRLH